MEAEPPPDPPRPPSGKRSACAFDADAWITGLDELRRDYEAGMAYADRFARRLASAIYAESVRVYAMSSEEIAKVEAMDEEERIAWMCGDGGEKAGATGDQPSLDLFDEDGQEGT